MKNFFVALVCSVAFAATAQVKSTSWTTTTNVQTARTGLGLGTNDSPQFRSVNVGTGAATSQYGSSNGWPVIGGMFPLMWNEYTDWNTNQVLITNSPQTAFNQLWVWNATMNAYTGAVNITRGLYYTNSLWTLSLNLYSTPLFTNVSVSALSGWGNTTTGTNTFINSWFPTNAVWRWETFGPVTNLNGLSNGVAIRGNSNGTMFLFTTPIGGTNVTATKLAP